MPPVAARRLTLCLGAWATLCLGACAAPLPPRAAAAARNGSESGSVLRRAGGREELVWGAVNILQLTDVHSYISGHRHQEEEPVPLDADFGTLVSFVHHMRREAAARGVPLWVVCSGDIVDGTGLSDITPVAGEFLTPLLKQMDYDVLTLGNHELYVNTTVTNLRDSGFIEHWQGGMLTGNVAWAADASPVGGRYRVLTQAGVSVLTLGFLAPSTCGSSCDPITTITAVADAMRAPWVRQALACAVQYNRGILCD